MTQLDNLIGEIGDQKILRTCRSQMCIHKTRTFKIIRASFDKEYLMYKCENCDEILYERKR